MASAESPSPLETPLNRRRFLAAGLLAVGSAGAADEDPEAAGRESVRARAKAAGLGEFKLALSPRFQALGNVSEAFLKLVLSDCEDVCIDYYRHFLARKWNPEQLKSRLTVVVLSTEIDYGRFLQEKYVTLNSGGRYDLKNNRLVVFDYRQVEERVGARVSWLNLMTLAHETTHQLCYNSGVLNRSGDCPRVIAEGLATYAEERPPGSRSSMGRINDNRLDDLANLQRRTDWLPIKSLMASDEALLGKLGGIKLLLAYAEAWLLTHYLMNQPELCEKFRDYLKVVYPRKDASKRVPDAELHFGDLGKLDARLREYSIRLLKSR